MAHTRRRNVITSYPMAQKFFAKARSKTEGRPLNAQFRMYADGEAFLICNRSRSRVFARLAPDNILTFVMPDAEVRTCCRADAVLPINMTRYKTGVYRICTDGMLGDHTPISPGGNPDWRARWTYARLEAPIYRQGISFNMLTGDCINPGAPWAPSPVDSDARKVWLRDLRKSKRLLKTMAKVGALDDMMAKLKADVDTMRTAGLPYPAVKLVPLLIPAMQTQEFSEDVVRGVLASQGYWSVRNFVVDARNLCSHIDAVFNSLSARLRREYGVFVDDKNPPTKI